jgi:hypothetical protein
LVPLIVLFFSTSIFLKKAGAKIERNYRLEVQRSTPDTSGHKRKQKQKHEPVTCCQLWFRVGRYLSEILTITPHHRRQPPATGHETENPTGSKQGQGQPQPKARTVANPAPPAKDYTVYTHEPATHLQHLLGLHNF